LVGVLTDIINEPDTTSILFIRGESSTGPSVEIGDYSAGIVDLDDIERFGYGVGQGMSAGSLLVHELQEQYRKQVYWERGGFDVHHAYGIAAEERAAGATRGPETRVLLDMTTVRTTIPYTYPDGWIVEVTYTYDRRSFNIISVSRRTRRAQ
jgi:hypothetical protein